MVKRMLRLILLLFAAAWFSGCVQTPGTQDGGQEFGGTFTPETTQSDLEDFRERMEAHGADDVLVMESFPMQFRVTGLDGDCRNVVDEARSLSYVADVTACRQTTQSVNGEEPTATTRSS